MRCHFDEDCRQVSTEGGGGLQGGLQGGVTGEHRGGLQGRGGLQVSTEGVTGGYRGEDTGEHRGGVTGGLL